jgi:protein TonB
VTGVEAVGPADPVFLAAARRHLLAHWRYRPATEDGRAVATSTLVTLRFELAG